MLAFNPRFLVVAVIFWIITALISQTLTIEAHPPTNLVDSNRIEAQAIPKSCADAIAAPTDGACEAYDAKLASQGWINDGTGNYTRR